VHLLFSTEPQGGKVKADKVKKKQKKTRYTDKQADVILFVFHSFFVLQRVVLMTYITL